MNPLGRGAIRGLLPSWSRAALVTAFAMATGALVMATGATAAPLAEVEPNNDSLHANGPFGADGFTSTLNVSDDVDFAIFRLQGRRQVELTFAQLTGCGSTVRLRVTEAAGDFVTDAGVGGGTQTRTWTTPRDATEYVARVAGFGAVSTGCQTLIKVAPTDALITSPLPAPSFLRTLSASNPGQVGQDAPIPITATGTAADEDRVAVLWTTGGCPVAPDDSLSGVVRGATLASGPYNVTLATTSPRTAGVATLCTWLYDTLGKLEPLLRQETVIVAAPPVDRDRDGVPAGPDCDDNNAAIKPGAREIRGNAIDENCDGRAEPYPRSPGTVTLGATPLRSGLTRIRSLVVRQVSRSYAVSLRCTGRGCRARARGTFRAARGTRVLSLTRIVGRMRLAPGARIRVKVSRPGYRSRIFSFTMRRRQAPSRSVRCANPGASLCVLIRRVIVRRASVAR